MTFTLLGPLSLGRFLKLILWCWKIILGGSLLFLSISGAEALTAFIPDDLFQGVYIINILKKTGTVSPFKETVRHAYYLIEKIRFPELRVPLL